MRAIESRPLWFKRILFCTIFLIGIVCTGEQLKEDETVDSLIKDPSGVWLLVEAHCTSCHSYSLISQQSLDRSGWKKAIRRMQSEENLWELGDLEPQILDYLSNYYGIRDDKKTPRPRRLPLARIGED